MKSVNSGNKKGQKTKLLNNSYKVLNLNGEQIYVLGIEKILKFSSEQVILRLKNSCQFVIYGEALIICECAKHSIMLSGKITKTEVC